MPSQEPNRLFIYGTLIDPERVSPLTGKQFARTDATLSDYARVESPLGCPFILPRPGTVVRGALLLNLDPVSLTRLDIDEAKGDLCQHQAVEVEVGSA